MARARLWLKVTASAVLVAVLGAGAALVALKLLFPEPKVRAYVVGAARKQLGREVRLARIDAGLTGLHLQDLEISERPDFAAGTFLRVETFTVRPSWRALLRRKFVVVTAAADGLTVRVVKNADGSFNFDTLASSGAAPGAPAPPKDPSLPQAEFNMRHLRVERGAVEYRDAAAGTSWALREASLRLDDFSLAAPFDLDLSFRAEGAAGGRPVDAAVEFSGALDPARGERAKMRAEIRRLAVSQDGLSLTLKGEVAGLETPVARLEARLSAAGKTVLTAKGGARLLAGGAADADLTFATPGLDTTALAKWLPSSGVPALAIPAAEGALAGRWEGESATARVARVKWAGGSVDASGSAKGLGGKSPVYEGKAAFGLDLPEIRPGDYAFLKLPPKAFLPASRVEGSASYAGGDLTVTALTAKFTRGTVSATGAVRRLASAKPVPDLTVRFSADLPAFALADAPVTVSALPKDFLVPALSVAGGARARGDDLTLDKVVIKGRYGSLRLDGPVAKALAGTPEPVLDAALDLDLPALTDKDLPFPGVPAGLELPPSRWDADLNWSASRLRLRRLGVKIGGNEVAVEGGVADPLGRASFDLLAKCKSFVLAELTRLTPKTRDLKLSGSGFFALSVTGTKEKPVFGGKLQFKDLGATVAGLPLSGFSGTVSFDERRVDAPNLKGRLDEGNLSMDLTVKDYRDAPEIQVEAALDRFDLARYFAAKKTYAQEAAAARAGKPAAPADAAPAKPLRTRGKLEIGELAHPNATVRAVTATWDLYGVTPDMKRLSGDAKFGVGGGRLHALGDLALQSPVVKVLVFPILIFQKLSFGVNLNDLTVTRIAGDYLFKDGLMTLRRSELEATVAAVSATGTIDLPAEALDLVVTAQVGNLAPLDVAVTGTVSAPKSKVKVGKLLGDAAKSLIDNLIKR